MKYGAFLIGLLLLLVVPPSVRAQDAQALTQRQWMIEMVNGLGWSFGLPDQPRDEDFLNILGGDREFRIEAEESKSSDDFVSVKKIRSYGPFSGNGWVSGISRPTEAHLNHHLPLGGDYKVQASLRLPGHRLSLGGKTFAVDGGDRFSEVDVGEVALAAGPIQVDVHLPPNGGIDYVRLFAPPLPDIHPRGGWRLDQPLAMDDLAVTVARALGFEALLPPVGEPLLFEAESSGVAKGAREIDATHLGRPSGGRWLRAGTGGENVVLRFPVPEPGIYTITVRGAADGEMRFSLNGRDRMSADFPIYLEDRPLGTFALPEGENELVCHLPPFAGIDALFLQAHRDGADDYLLLVGLSDGNEPPRPRQLDRLLGLTAAVADRR